MRIVVGSGVSHQHAVGKRHGAILPAVAPMYHAYIGSALWGGRGRPHLASLSSTILIRSSRGFRVSTPAASPVESDGCDGQKTKPSDGTQRKDNANLTRPIAQAAGPRSENTGSRSGIGAQR